MFFFLLALWLIFSGNLSVSTVVLGSVVSGLITLFCIRFMGYHPKSLILKLKKADKAVLYLLCLFKEIILANWAVLKLIYRPKAPEPVLVHFRSGLKTDGGRVLAANSITLTPGTYTVSLDGDAYCVHALDRSLAAGIEDCSFFEKLRQMEA